MTEHNPPNSVYYDDMIDLRQLVKTFWNYKWIIIATTLVAALAAFLTSKYLLREQYEASAHIGIRRPTFSADLEPGIENPSTLQDYRDLTDLTKSLPALAEADDVWLTVCQQMELNCQGKDRDEPDLEASLIGTNQLKLTVTCKDPELSAEFANLWAEEVIHRWNRLYGNESINLEQIQEEVENARQLWSKTQQSLKAYLPLSKINVVEVQLFQAKDKLSLYLNEIESNQNLIRDAQALDVRLNRLDQNRVLPVGESLTLIALQLRTSGEASDQASEAQFQLPSEQILGVGYSVEAARESIRELISALESQNTSLEGDLPVIEGEITSLAVELEDENYKVQQLTHDRDRAYQVFQFLSGYLDETEINQNNQMKAAYNVAQARVPVGSSGQSALMMAALAGMVGLIISAGGVLVYSWWTSEGEND